MTTKLLAATTLMLVTTAAAWAEGADTVSSSRVISAEQTLQEQDAGEEQERVGLSLDDLKK